MLAQKLREIGLSGREAEVAEMVTRGYTNKVVASHLFVTEKTIKFHLTNIFRKLGVKSRAQLIVWALPLLNFVEPVAAQPETQKTEKRPEAAQEPAFKLPFSMIGKA